MTPSTLQNYLDLCNKVICQLIELKIKLVEQYERENSVVQEAEEIIYEEDRNRDVREQHPCHPDDK